MGIVVGYDGSEQSQSAVRWAARQAQAEHRTLHLVHCWIWPLFTHDLGPVNGVADSGLKHSAEAILAEGLAVARQQAPDVDIKTSLITGQASRVLRDLSSAADMLVVGSRGLGGFMGLLVGSVGLQLGATAQCPVAVVRSGANDGGAVVVGVDGSPQSMDALQDACSLARSWRAPLTIVHVRKEFRMSRAGKTLPGSEAEERKILADAADLARAAAPDSEVTEMPVTGRSVADALLKASRDARVVVVGAKGQGAFTGALGSTAHAVLHHAKTDVLISRRALPSTAESAR